MTIARFILRILKRRHFIFHSIDDCPVVSTDASHLVLDGRLDWLLDV